MSDGNGALPEGWAETTFGDIFDFKGGSQPPKKQFVQEPRDGYIRLLQIRDFASDAFPVYIKDSGRWPKCSEDDVMIARYGASLGRVLTGMAGAYNVALIKMIFDRENIDVVWARYFLMSNNFQAPIHLLSRSAQNGFNKREVAPIKVQLPPLAEQRRIVAKIESLQERSSRARQALSEVGPLLEQFRQSVLRAAFSGRLTADWRAAHPDVEPATELLSRIRTERRKRWEQSELAKYEAKGKKPPQNWQEKYKEPEQVDEAALPDLPNGWCWISLESTTTLITDGKHGDCRDEANSGYYFLSVKDIRDGKLDYSNVREICESDFMQVHQRTDLELNDILIASTGATIGKIAIASDPERTRRSTFQKSLAIVKPLTSGVRTRFLAEFLRFQITELRARAMGTAVKNLLLRDLRAVPVPLASIEEQKLIVAFLNEALNSAEDVYDVVTESKSALTQLDQSILAKAFRGELVPQDPRDEPASELLARIRSKRETAKAAKAEKKNQNAAKRESKR